MLRLIGGQPYDLGHRSAQISIKAAAKSDALAEDKARVDKERAKMARLRAARLAREKRQSARKLVIGRGPGGDQ
jgi:hypothetical protein